MKLAFMRQIPHTNPLSRSFGTEYARGFIEAQLRGMEPGTPRESFKEPLVQ